MAEIKNQRDKILQGSPIRFIQPALPPDVQAAVNATRGVRLTASSYIFKVSVNGTVTPTTITLTARPSMADGPVTFSVVSGTVSLVGVGNVRTIAAGNMSTDQAVIRASVMSGGSQYTDEVTISKAYDGTPGGNGTPGRRGTVNVPIAKAGPPWEDSAAVAAIAAFTGSTNLVEGDVVTQYATGWVDTRYWTGSTWTPAAKVIDGNLVVRGTLWAEDIRSGGTISGNNVAGAQSLYLEGSTPGSSVGGFYIDSPGSNSGSIFIKGTLRVNRSGPGNTGSLVTLSEGGAGFYTMVSAFEGIDGNNFLRIRAPQGGAIRFEVNNTEISGSLGSQLTRIGRTYNATITPKNGIDPAYNVSIAFTAT